jgi:hypothetical protein
LFAAVKLAPIFQLKSKTKVEAEDFVILDDDKGAKDAVEVVLTEEEKERQRLKREFLFSSIPTGLKKQMSEQSLPVELNYPPWPSVSHVQQAVETEIPWSLPSDVSLDSLPFKLKSDDAVGLVPAATTPGALTHCCRMSSHAVSGVSFKKLSHLLDSDV